jgi:hypothetical protein
LSRCRSDPAPGVRREVLRYGTGRSCLWTRRGVLHWRGRPELAPPARVRDLEYTLRAADSHRPSYAYPASAFPESPARSRWPARHRPARVEGCGPQDPVPDRRSHRDRGKARNGCERDSLRYRPPTTRTPQAAAIRQQSTCCPILNHTRARAWARRTKVASRISYALRTNACARETNVTPTVNRMNISPTRDFVRASPSLNSLHTSVPQSMAMSAGAWLNA